MPCGCVEKVQESLAPMKTYSKFQMGGQGNQTLYPLHPNQIRNKLMTNYYITECHPLSLVSELTL